MRIIGGKARGLRLTGPGKIKIRPTSDKVREALFNMIDVGGSSFLDLFAGTGAAGCEAISRGASHVTFVENHKTSVSLIRKNVDKVLHALESEPSVKVVKIDALKFLEKNLKIPERQFEYLFCDPPYEWEENLPELLQIIAAGKGRGALAPGGTLILETRSSLKTELPFKYEKRKKYGDTALIFFPFSGLTGAKQG